MRLPDLPPNLPRAFSVAEARKAGASASRLRARDLERPFHGVRVRGGSGEQPHMEHRVEGLARAYATRMPDSEFFSHVTAGVLWGLPLPHTVLAPGVLDVSVLWSDRAPRGAGVRGHALQRELVAVATSAGLRLSSPASTWATLGTVLGVPDLVAVGDALVREPRNPRERPALASIADLDAAVRAGRRPGVRRLRDAIVRIRPRVDSRTETRLRLLLVDAGVPEPETGWDVWDVGDRLARVDLAYPHMRIALEYEGEHHLVDPRQWAYDIRRYERLEAAGWLVIRVTKDDLFARPHLLVARVRAALARRS